MDFVDDVNFILAAGGGIGNSLVDLPDIVDAAVGGSVDFHDVEGSALGDVKAGGAFIARLAIVFEGLAIERFSKEAGKRGFAGSSAAAKEIGRGDFPQFDGIFEGSDNRFLPHNAFESLGAVFSRNILVHELKYIGFQISMQELP